MIISDLLAGIHAGDRRSVARALSLIESTAEDDKDLAVELLSGLRQTETSRRIGISGPPGVGKSTLIEHLGLNLCNSDERVAVLAVDPSSKRSGGSILGDKLRMVHLSNHPNAFIRPSPARTTLGGITSTMRESILVCEAAGYSTIIIETVGVGQSEVEVAEMVDAFVLLLLPQSGDDVQGIKRGVMEMADIVVVTKADIDILATNRSMAQIKGALRYMPTTHGNKTPVVASSVEQPYGLDALQAELNVWFSNDMQQHRTARRKSQLEHWFDVSLRTNLITKLLSNTAIERMVMQLQEESRTGNLIPSVAVHRLLSSITINISERS